jgi:hypothetical protein
MFGEKLRAALPRELGALGVIVLSLFIAERVAGIIPIGLERNFAFL